MTGRFVQSPRAPFDFARVVLIADQYRDQDDARPIHRRRDLEKTDRQTLSGLMAAIRQLGLEVCHYATPAELARNASQHANDVVLTIYGGDVSRNRMALVPAVCETFGLRYLGPDACGRFLCQDKYVTKLLAAEVGLKTPRAEIVRRLADLPRLETLALPFVIKPLMEGSSIGIAQENLIQDRAAGYELARRLLAEYAQPVIAEEFQPGREVSCNFILGSGRTDYAFTEIVMIEDRDFFSSNLFDAAKKVHAHGRYRVDTVDEILDAADYERIVNLLQVIGKIDYCRVDGKWHDGRFVFLEMSPDAWISPEGAFAAGFLNKGWRYCDIIAAILECARGQGLAEQGAPKRQLAMLGIN
jgi:D-alanine-D-alanine ligase